MRTAVITHTRTGCELSCPYDEDFLQDLKDSIPGFARKWDAERKLWAIKIPYVEIAVSVARLFFSATERGKREEGAKQSATPCARPHYDPQSDHSVLHLLPSAPQELVKAAYRCLALLNHPDRGGDTATMQKINSAFTRLTK
jgi:hypothetical protein